MKRVLVSVFVMSACAAKAPPPPACPAGPILASAAELKQTEDKMCACNGDGTCIEGALQERGAMALTFTQVAELARDAMTCGASNGGVDADKPGTGIAECDGYIAMIDAYMKCDMVPQQARDAAKQELDARSRVWANSTSLPQSARQTISLDCLKNSQAIKQGAKAMGCTL